MHPLRESWAYALGWMALAFAAQACSAKAPAIPANAPIVAGLSRPGLEPRVRGLVLLAELGCVACHEQGAERRGPDLSGVGARIRAEYLPRFLADPKGLEPGTTMPDLLRDRPAAARMQAAEALSEYLRSFSERVAASEEPDSAAALRGSRLFHEVGCAACHSPRTAEGGEQALAGSVPLGDLAAKYELPGLRAFLLAPQDVRPALRMPDLHLEPGEAQDLSCYLLAQAKPTAPSTALDPAKVAAGRALFAERGCANCHTLEDPQRAPARPAKVLRALNPGRGCMSGEEGPWPFYALDDEQYAAIATALRALDAPLTDEQRIRQQLASRNCTACHEYGGSGGVAPERNPYFTSNDDNLGQDGRLPPPLTGVGAKLQHDWLVDSIAYGQSIRPYVRTRMPGFGKPVALELAGLFERSASLAPLELAALPEDAEKGEALIQLGCELVGDKGMGCLDCHAFAGERVGMLAGIDLVDSTTQRLRREWFASFLRAPYQFRSGTLMPQFFAGKLSTRPELGGGDAAQQIDALWFYLAQGRNVRKPSGMRHTPIPLEVGGEAVLLRRSLQNTGKRAISVGLPLGVNFSFDAKSLNLNQIWWGKFLDAAGVWTGQGSGEARILGDELANLADASTPWPAAESRFLGYDLDAEQRPAFRYVCADVSISDAPRELALAGSTRPILRRTLSFASASDKLLTFRAALDAHIEDLGAGLVAVGRALRVQLPPGSYRIRASGAARELVVEIAIRKGQAELVIDYAWAEESK